MQSDHYRQRGGVNHGAQCHAEDHGQGRRATTRPAAAGVCGKAAQGHGHDGGLRGEEGVNANARAALARPRPRARARCPGRSSEVLSSMVDEKSLIDARVDVARFARPLASRAVSPFRRPPSRPPGDWYTDLLPRQGSARAPAPALRNDWQSFTGVSRPGSSRPPTLLSKQGQMWAFLISRRS